MNVDADSASATVPHAVRLHLGRAAVQTLAGQVGVRLLHIKGDTVDRSIRKNASPGTDIDILVDPGQIDALDTALRARGWRIYSTFVGGSPFGHAQTYLHDTWGYLDVHRSFPGIGIPPEQAFDRLWSSRGAVDVSGVSCAAPDLTSQAVIAILNAARSRQRSELDGAWSDADSERRNEIEREVDVLDARLAFDAAFGRLDAHRGAREFKLWKAVTEGGGRVEEWWGRILAEQSLSARVALVLRAPLVNRTHLEHQLGRPPTRRDVFYEFLNRPIRGVRELLRQRF
ncbi:hypothetical protein [Agromyces bracchium]|uniref:2-nitropropane dioxygenase n=1 Tax=Agromyces bracchium TaxID=88376 RepID=A0A6I3LZX2_9MICO|nr:hypothetical protein [Agromyces bracchium]MTH66899.1 hypothetical protein [Agromyces bracchium]